MTLVLLSALFSTSAGALLYYWLERWHFSCRTIGHVWRNFEYQGAHVREPALRFRVCKYCKKREPR